MLTVFLEGIHQKKYLSVDFVAKEDGLLRNRKCVPFDYGKSKKYKDNHDRFHFLDLDSPQGSHTLSILPEQVKRIELVHETFEPSEYVTWSPNWVVSRDWGIYS